MNYSVTGEQLTAIADAIRTKMHGSARTAQIEFPDGFTSKISGISAGLSCIETTQMWMVPYSCTVPANSELKLLENVDGFFSIKEWTFYGSFTGKQFCYFRAEPKEQFPSGSFKTDIYLVNPTDSDVTTSGQITVKFYKVTAVI